MIIRKSNGFTLIELLVVIAIISLLSSIVMSSLNSARSKARDVVRLSDARQLKLALGLYYSTNGVYPTTVGYQRLAGGATALQALVTGGFISKVPSDPNSTNTGDTNNEYYYGSPGWWDTTKAYQIQFQLENRNDGAGVCYLSSCPSMWGSRYMYSVYPD